MHSDAGSAELPSNTYERVEVLSPVDCFSVVLCVSDAPSGSLHLRQDGAEAAVKFMKPALFGTMRCRCQVAWVTHKPLN